MFYIGQVAKIIVATPGEKKKFTNNYISITSDKDNYYYTCTWFLPQTTNPSCTSFVRDPISSLELVSHKYSLTLINFKVDPALKDEVYRCSSTEINEIHEQISKLTKPNPMRTGANGNKTRKRTIEEDDRQYKTTAADRKNKK